MNRPVVHLRIAQLVIDAEALDGTAVPRELAARLHASLMSQWPAAEPARAPARWVDAAGGALAVPVRDALGRISR